MLTLGLLEEENRFSQFELKLESTGLPVLPIKSEMDGAFDL